MSGFYIDHINVTQTVSINEGKSVTTEANVYLSDQQANMEPNDVSIIVGGMAYAIGDALKKHIEPDS